MTDGMMSAYRDSERRNAIERFLCELVRYLKRKGTPRGIKQARSVLYSARKNRTKSAAATAG